MKILQEEYIGDFEADEEEEPPTEFHGEPVPDDVDDDDLFEQAAGLPKKKKEPKPIEEEPVADEHFFELDYCKLVLIFPVLTFSFQIMLISILKRVLKTNG